MFVTSERLARLIAERENSERLVPMLKAVAVQQWSPLLTTEPLTINSYLASGYIQVDATHEAYPCVEEA